MNTQAPLVLRGDTWPKVIGWLGILLIVFCLLQATLPLGTALQIGADEGFELAKAVLWAHGHLLYSEVWNDQPPLHTYLVTQILKHVAHSILAARLLTSAFTIILLGSLFFLIHRHNGLRTAVVAVALLIVSPGFLELSASCMLEIPALALSIAGLSLLANVHARKSWPNILAAMLFGAAVQIKLISLVWTPLAALLLLNRLIQADSQNTTSSPTLSLLVSNSRNLAFIKQLFIFGVVMLVTAAGVDLLVDHGAYLANFRESWQSHFSKAKTWQFGSASEHQFDWSIFLRNWDTSVPAIVGITAALSRIRNEVRLLFPLAWLAWALLVFANHTPWWAYYYIHTAVPLCWLAALGFIWLLDQGLAKSRGRLVKSRKKWKLATPPIFLAIFMLCAAAWMAGRMCLEVADIRKLPRTYGSLVISETQRYRPFCHWLYADDLMLSFYTDIPMPPDIAVVPLKRLWSGEMTPERMAAEFARYRPELAILNNSDTAVPFRDTLDSNYRMVYEDDRYQLYAVTNIIVKAQSQ